MDAVEFYKAFKRMCEKTDCKDCLLDQKCRPSANVEPEEVVELVEEWAKDHPIKTRQSAFLKLFPNAYLKTITRLLPCSLDSSLKPLRCAKYGYLSITCRCDRCRDDYWNEEVTDNGND